jgi:hypothetical protein
MQNYQNSALQRPILKPKPKLVGVVSKIPKQLRLSDIAPLGHRDTLSLSPEPLRDRVSLSKSIDYDALTLTQQARLDNGLYGSIEQKKINGYYYYYLRFRCKESGKLRSKYLGKEWVTAMRKMQQFLRTG